jgi:hypothetical protein
MNRTPTGRAALKPSRKGITLFEGDLCEFDDKVEGPGALQVAQYLGLELCWEHEQNGNLLVLFMKDRGETSSPILRIPLTENEAHLIHGCREKGCWWYYDLQVEETDDRAGVTVSFLDEKDETTTLLWILDRRRRALFRRAVDCFVGLRDPIFGD